MRVAHISDLHLLSLSGARIRDFLGKRVTGGINLLLNRGGEFPEAVLRLLVDDVRAQAVEHVIVSGDLTNLAFPSELARVREILQGFELPSSAVTIIPGNHDYYTRDSHRRDHFGRLIGSGRFPTLHLNGELAVVGLNSAHPTPMFMAWGTLGPGQIEDARGLLASDECRRRFRLVALHHPPHMEHVAWHNRLVDRAAFARMLRDVGAELVVHGHLHRPIRWQLKGPDGPIPVVGVGSGTWLSPHDPSRRAQYNVYRVEGKRLVELATRRLGPDQRFGPV